MSKPPGQPEQDGSHHRPRSIAELAQQAHFTFDQSLSMMSYVRGAENLRRQATVYEKEQDYETAFVLLTRSAKLALDHIPKHREFKTASKDVNSQLIKTSKLSMEDMRRLKPKLKERYETWRAERIDGLPASETVLPETADLPPSSTPYIPYAPSASPGPATPSLATRPVTSSAFHTPFIPYSPVPSMPPYSQPISYPKLPVASTSRSPSQQSTQGIGGFADPSSSTMKPVRNDAVQPLQPTRPSRVHANLRPSYTEGGMPLRNMVLPACLMETFAAIALRNTNKNLETCALIMGQLSRNVFTATTLLVPKQSATSDTCTTTNEEDIFAISDSRDLIVLGWIHTHPRQTCFLSSVDLHTHYSYQQMLPEAVAIVIAPTASPSIGIFRMTDPLGLQVIGSCKEPGMFHPHPNLPIYTDANGMHVSLDPKLKVSVIDVR